MRLKKKDKNMFHRQEPNSYTKSYLLVVRFGGMSVEFCGTMVSVLAIRSRAKIAISRPDEPDMPPKPTKISKDFHTVLSWKLAKGEKIFLILRVGVQ